MNTAINVLYTPAKAFFMKRCSWSWSWSLLQL